MIWDFRDNQLGEYWALFFSCMDEFSVGSGLSALGQAQAF